MTAPVTPEQARAIAKEAYVYGFPMVDSYRIQYSYFVDKSGPEYKGEWNQVHNTARVSTPADTAIQTRDHPTAAHTENDAGWGAELHRKTGRPVPRHP